VDSPATLRCERERRPGYLQVVRALTSFSTQCPSCHSEDTRPSRALYVGRIAAKLELTPFRCRVCGRLFPTTVGARRHYMPYRGLLTFPPDSD